MASPHVAGVAALYLAAHTTATPAKVRDALVAAATRDIVAGRGDGSPNVLLYSRFLVTAPPTPPSVTVLAPNGGQRLTAVTSFFTIPVGARAGDPDGLSRFDVMLSTDGVNYSSVCGEPGRQPPQLHVGLSRGGQTNARIRVTAYDTLGATASTYPMLRSQSPPPPRLRSGSRHHGHRPTLAASPPRGARRTRAGPLP